MTQDSNQFQKSAESTLHGAPPAGVVITSEKRIERSEPDSAVMDQLQPEIEMAIEKYTVTRKVQVGDSGHESSMDEDWDEGVESKNETFSNVSKIYSVAYKKKSNDTNLQNADQISESNRPVSLVEFCGPDPNETEAALNFWTDIKKTDVDDQQVINRVKQSHTNEIVFDFDAVEAADENKFVEQQEDPMITEREKPEIDDEEMQPLPGETTEETLKRLNEIRMYAIFVHSLTCQSLSRHGRERHGT